MSERLPEISHLQAAVLSAIGASKVEGRELRNALKDYGINKSSPAFYQLMARLEDAEMVTGEYGQRTVDGQTVRVRMYTLTGLGAKAMADARGFYAGLNDTLTWLGAKAMTGARGFYAGLKGVAK